MDPKLKAALLAVRDAIDRALASAPVPKTTRELQEELKRELKRPRFTPPTLEEVETYCRERQNVVDAEAFVDFYTTNGWVQGRGKPIKDWRAAVRTWEKSRQRPSLLDGLKEFVSKSNGDLFEPHPGE